MAEYLVHSGCPASAFAEQWTKIDPDTGEKIPSWRPVDAPGWVYAGDQKVR